MKKTIFKILAALFSFSLAVLISSYFMNKSNVNTTQTMKAATLPVVTMNVGGTDVNTLYGYTMDFDEALFRENITPLDDNRGVSFRVSKYGNVIKGLTVKLRSINGDRLIESIDITDYEEDNFFLEAVVNFKGLIDEYTEYSLSIELLLSNSQTVVYHTRVIDAPLYCAREKLQFVKDFHEKEGDVFSNEALKDYMESNYTGDNTTLQFVNIHSSMKQLAFGNLNMEEISDLQITFKELNVETAVFTIDYVAKNTDGEDEYRYFVEEYYRIKYAGETMYLLDYEREMNCISDKNSLGFTDSIIRLGITDPEIEFAESEDGNVFAFVNENALYSFDIAENKLALLFCFYDEDNFDERTIHDENKIKILSVDEAGNVSFIVYGYMNRGTYEGMVGMTYYEYNGVTNVIDEKFFISSEKTPEMLMSDIDEISYQNKNGRFYCMIDRTIYAIDIETNEINVIVRDLEENMYTVSESREMLVWVEGNDVNSSESINVCNLNTRQINKISAPEGEYIKPLAFIGEDLIYGLAQKDDIITDRAGRTTFPMYCFKIQNEYGELMKIYENNGVYITNVSVKDNLISIERVVKNEGEELSYISYESDYITNNTIEGDSLNTVEIVVNGDYEKILQIRLYKDKDGAVIFLNPEQVIYEGSKELSLDSSETTKKHYYVYYKGHLQKISTKPSEAVKEADSNYGTVLNDEGFYVWYRANRDYRNQIMDLSIDVTDEEKNNIAFCLDHMLEYEGIIRNSEYLLSKGETILSILEEALEDYDVLDLTGTGLDSVLYYVNRDIPVLVLLDEGKAYLIIGYNQLSIVILDPAGGWYKIGINEAEKMFEETGNQFITYVPNK